MIPIFVPRVTVVNIPQVLKDESYWMLKYAGLPLNEPTRHAIHHDILVLYHEDRAEGRVSPEREHFRWILSQFLDQFNRG